MSMAETLNISSNSDLSTLNTQQKIPLVLLHGWGLNSGVWQPFIDNLSSEFLDAFSIITLDLPGFGVNVDKEIHPYTLKDISQSILNTITQPAIYLGWSLGGLIATEMALNHPEKVLGLITVTSSPRFLEEIKVLENEQTLIWPGIKSNVLSAFHQQLGVDTKKTISGFLKIQAMGSPHIRQDIKLISQLVFQHKMANQQTLDESLSLLETSDFRARLKNIKQPFLRLYGQADSLVPKSVIQKVNQLAPKSDHHVFPQASHAPFISHTNDFSQILTDWLVTKVETNFNQ